MKRKIKIAAIILIMLSPLSVFSVKNEKFAVGFRGGTYESIAKSLNASGILPCEIINTQGSDEIIELVNKGDAAFGIAQLDILLNAYNQKDWSVKNVQFVLPLYSEEVHLLAKKSIRGIDDLSGRSISIGDLGSGTSGTALLLLKNSGVKKSISGEYVYKPAGDGLDLLKKGDIDALFIVAGAPVELLSKLPADFKKGFHLVPLGDDVYKKLSGSLFHYRQTTIRAKTYPWLSAEVKTVSVVSAIIVNRSASNAVIGGLIKSIFSNRKKLEANHPKWKELNKETIKWYLGGRTDRFHPAAVETLITIVKD